MVEEMESLKENHTYELVELPNGKKALKNKQDLGEAKQILGMRISQDMKEKKLWLSQEMYIEKILRMHKAKSVGTPLAENFKLSKKQCPSSVEEKQKMKRLPYASAVGSLMYAMVCTWPDLAHAVGVVS
ncbi:hypothetical protein Tco_1542510, partial [Tanacetum coccineum]